MKENTVYELAGLCKLLTAITGEIRDQTHEAVATNDHIVVIKHYNDLRLLTAQIKEAREALEGIEMQLSREQVPDVMRAHNVRNITVEGVGRVTLGTRWSASMLDKQSAFTWLRDNNHGGVIQETVNAQTLGALAKELNDSGVELPTDTFKTSVMTYTSITRIK
jgi:hypothetical protein